MKFLIADDHPIILVALTEMLATAFPDRISRIDTVSDGHGLLRRVNDTHYDYDYLTLDMEMPERPRGISLLEAVRTARPSLKIIVYTGHVSPCLALTAIDLGAVAYVSKGSGPQLAIDAIRAVLYGHTFIDPSIDLDAARNHPWNHLTASEREVLLALGRGENMQALAIDSERSYKTVTTHKYNALRKLGLRSKAEIGVFLSRHGLDYLLD
jgi:DNA-binding NarL/FixJ family response regulator